MLKKYLLASCLLTCFLTTPTYAGGDHASANPLANIDYSKVGNLRHIQSRYRHLMKELECNDNVFCPNNQQIQKVTQAPRQTLKAYQEECLSYLQSLRRRTVLRPATEAGAMIVLLGATTAVIVTSLGLDSFGGSLGFSSAAYNGVFQLKDAITAMHHWWMEPTHPVDECEKQYVKEQCFIPRQLWPEINEQLMLARQNPYGQQEALNFLSFTLGLTTYAPKVPLYLQLSNKKILLSTNSTPEERMLISKRTQSILDNINTFFKDYESFKDGKNLPNLRISVKNFIQSLIKKGQQPRPILLHGEGGIGKTYFAKQLTDWIRELLPENVSYEQITITTTRELEGEKGYPGLFLRVLRNQCQRRTRGSIVMMDEATWLNKPEFEAPAKRTFNGALTTLSTTYFGEHLADDKANLTMPLTLTIAAANQPIEEKNLKSRFDHIEFPMPLPNTLNNYAQKLFSKQKQENDMDISLETTEKEALQQGIKEAKSFRDIEAIVPILFDQLYGTQL